MDYLTVPFEVKSGAGDRAGVVSGYGSTFGNVDLQDDIIEPGAFAETIRENPKGWPMLFGHDSRKPVGFWIAAREDAKGLYLDGEFTLDSPEGASAYALVRHGARLGQPFGLSIGYAVRDGGARVQSGYRRLSSVSVLEVSLAAVPANQLARVTAVKSAAAGFADLAECKTPTEVNRVLRSLGMSKRKAADLLYMVRTSEDEPEEFDDEPEPFAKQLRMAVQAAEEREGQQRKLIGEMMEKTIQRQIDAKIRPETYCRIESVSVLMAEWKSQRDLYVSDYPSSPAEAEARFLLRSPMPRKDCQVFNQIGYNEARQAEAARIVNDLMVELGACKDAGAIDQMLGNWRWPEKQISEFIKLREKS